MGNFLFLFMLIFSVVVTLSSSSWLVCWMMMEISSFFFVPILYGVWSVSSSVMSLKYFLVQSIGSSLFLFSILWDSYGYGGWEWISDEKDMGLITYISMMMKLGIFPFSGWMIRISENMSWKNFFLLSSIQEVIPLIMISKFGNSENVFLFFICMSMFVFVAFSMMNYSIHYMMMISSMFNVCWMVMAALLGEESLIFFIFVYFMVLSIFFWVLESVISVGSLAVASSYSLYKGGKILFIFIVFMMMGFPPFGNFLGKVEVLSGMVSEDMIWLAVYFVLLSSIFMYLYLKICLSVTMSMKGSFMKEERVSMKIVLLSVLFVLFLFWFF